MSLINRRVVEDRDAWNESLANLDGHLLQTWQWGEFKREHGWRPERVAIGERETRAMAQVLFRHKGPASVGYVPRGPVVAPDDLEAAKLLLDAIDNAARRHRALYIIIEANTEIAGLTRHPLPGLELGPAHLQPGRTVMVPLLDDDQILAGMHQKTRYSVRLAPRKGVVVDRHVGDDLPAVAEFYHMLSETSRRNEFGIHTLDYYSSFMRHFSDNATLLIARVDGHPAAGIIAVAFGRDAIYMYGASDTQYRSVGAAFNLQFQAMQWGRAQGASQYDMWGIPDVDPPKDNEHRDRVPATKGDDWRGLYRFKTGFGGSIVSYPPAIQRTYHRQLGRLADRLVGRSQ
ncbi:MAG: peptidoglycan bridge formation glycyltransferase FemA/FemB family protein [Thermomicrobiales bacterium]|nr:peptidoglycan bridge formation glycyltransferase FemA/FemB family protein [Thermomicrobiales bacterium]